MKNNNRYYRTSSKIILKYFREGLSSYISGDSNKLDRANIDLTISLGGDELHSSVSLYGPGDVIGFDDRIIPWTIPKDGERNHDPNLIPTAFFHDPDFPWRFTPSRPDINDELMPWLTLLILKEKNEYLAFLDTKSKTLRIKNICSKSLPDLNFSSSTAFVEVFPEPNESRTWDITLDGKDKETSCDLLSRIMCFRRLSKKTSYKAFIVPTFKLGCYPTKHVNNNINKNTLSWSINSESEVNLPVYYDWSFHTS